MSCQVHWPSCSFLYLREKYTLAPGPLHCPLWNIPHLKREVACLFTSFIDLLHHLTLREAFHITIYSNSLFFTEHISTRYVTCALMVSAVPSGYKHPKGEGLCKPQPEAVLTHSKQTNLADKCLYLTNEETAYTIYYSFFLTLIYGKVGCNKKR